MTDVAGGTVMTDDIKEILDELDDLDDDAALRLAQENQLITGGDSDIDEDDPDSLVGAVYAAATDDDIDFGVSQYKSISSAAAARCEHINKSDINDVLEEAIQEAGAADRTELTKWIQEHVERIVIETPRERRSGRRYTIHTEQGPWHLSTVDGGAQYRAAGWWREKILEEYNEDVDDPDSDKIDWGEWVRRLRDGDVEDVTVEHETYDGPRFAAVEDLRSQIRESRAYSDLSDAMAEGALYVTDDAVYVPAARIDDLLEDREPDFNGFREEIGARDLDYDGIEGYATTESADLEGSMQWQRYWVFDRGGLDAEPRVIDPDGSDAAEAVAAAFNDGASDDDASGSDSDAPSADDDDDGGSAGVEDRVVAAMLDLGGDDDGVGIDELADRAAEAYAMDKTRVESVIERLKDSGDVFQPSNKEYQLIEDGAQFADVPSETESDEPTDDANGGDAT